MTIMVLFGIYLSCPKKFASWYFSMVHERACRSFLLGSGNGPLGRANIYHVTRPKFPPKNARIGVALICAFMHLSLGCVIRPLFHVWTNVKRGEMKWPGVEWAADALGREKRKSCCRTWRAEFMRGKMKLSIFRHFPPFYVQGYWLRRVVQIISSLFMSRKSILIIAPETKSPQ